MHIITINPSIYLRTQSGVCRFFYVEIDHCKLCAVNLQGTKKKGNNPVNVKSENVWNYAYLTSC